MPRFFTDQPIVPGVPLTLGGENAHHISFSLRMRVGESLVVCSGGKAYDCVIQAFSVSEVTVAPERERPETEPALAVSMMIALSKGDKLDFCIQKCVELGAAEIIPFRSEHCIVKGSSVEAKGERRQKIAAEAAKQCGRAVVPTVWPVCSFDEALKRGQAADLRLFCSELPDAAKLSDVLHNIERKTIHTVSVFSGPEGGFAQKEFDKASEMGYNMITLGKRILRCETAPLCVLSALMYAFGEF